MIRRSTLVYIVILVALVATSYYLKNRKQSAADILVTPSASASEAATYLFTADDGVPTSIRIVAKSGETIEVARDADNAWAVLLPIKAKAEQGMAEAAASQVTTLRVLDSVANVDLNLVGVQDPEYLLNIKFSSGKERTTKIGVVTPTESGYYVQDAAGGDVLIVSKTSLDSLLGMLKSPPYLETLTPSPVPTETPIPPTPVLETPTNETVTPQT